MKGLAARWIAATAGGELLAYGLVAVAGAALTPEVAGALPAPGWIVGGGMIVMGTLEGAILGLLQWLALGRAVPGARFVGATTLALTVAWTLGLLASFLEPPRAPTLLDLLLQAGGGGAALGALLGAAQTPALRRGGLQVGRFWLQSAGAWAGGLIASALLAEVLPDGPYGLVTTVMAMATGGVTGLVVGTLTAPAVERMHGGAADGA